MKKVLLTTATIAAMTTAAVAAPLGYWGSVEYATEAETFEAVAGVSYTVGALTVTPSATFDLDVGEFDSAEIMGVYEINENLSGYATVDFDADFNHTETTVGIAFAF